MSNATKADELGYARDLHAYINELEIDENEIFPKSLKVWAKRFFCVLLVLIALVLFFLATAG